MSRRVDPQATRDAVWAVREWLLDGDGPEPDRAVIGAAVKFTARTLAALAPGASVEVRVPPFVAVQCISGPRYTRGTPPNVVETDARSWLLLAVGLLDFHQAAQRGLVLLSGARAPEIAALFPLVRMPQAEHD